MPPTRRRSKFVAALSLGTVGVASMTLMACYGMAPCDYTAADGSMKHDGHTCDGVCVAPDSNPSSRCYGHAPTDAGARDGG